MPEFLASFLHTPWMLLGLAALLIPPLIHLLNRRRYDVVDWGAMQFLQVREVTRRRLLIEELVLMGVRMGLLAALVFALAGPFFKTSRLARLGGRPNRDVVLVFDGSHSMAATDAAGRQSPHDAAKEWALAFLADLTPGDTVAVLQAKQQVVPVVGELSHDLARARKAVQALPAPAGGCDWPAALKHAHLLLAGSQRAQREVVLLSDGQKHGWADADTLYRWELLSGELGYSKRDSSDDALRPRLWAVNLAPGRTAQTPNWALTPLAGNRPVVAAGRPATFRTELVLLGQPGYAPPHRVRLEVDGQWVRDLPVPRSAPLTDGKVPLAFTHAFAAPGSHLLSLVLEADPPAGQRGRGYALKDRVPGDNAQDFAVEVVRAVPVLLVDGDPTAPADERGSRFLRLALSPQGDPAPAVTARVVPVKDFSPALLQGEARPRVLVLSNVAKLEPEQGAAVAAFLADGGGVLVALGERVDADAYNDGLYRGGDGWLPARLDGIEGSESRPAEAARPDPAGFTHPALEVFAGGGPGMLADARFPRWWKLTTPGKHSAAVTAGSLQTATARFPLFVERAYQAGRVMVCAVPLDNAWGTNLHELPAFVLLAHEVVSYLAGARGADFNLRAGQPLRHRLASADVDLSRFTLQAPGGEPRKLSADPSDRAAHAVQVVRQEKGAVLLFDGARETGVWRLRTPGGATVHYVVQPDARESDLTPCDDKDRAAVARFVPLEYQDDGGAIGEARNSERQHADYWQWFLAGVVLLLAAEVWMTRRMVKGRQA